MLTKSRPHALAVLLTLLATLLAPITALGHDVPGAHTHGAPGHDRPGPPPILTSVTLVWVEYPFQLDQDDWGADIEMNVTSSVQHQGHGYGQKSISDPDLNWNSTFGTWLLAEDVYSHRECTPMEPLTINLTGYEADASNLDALEKTLLNLLLDLANTDKFVLPKSQIARIIAGIFALLNPDDYLGFGSVVAPAPGPYDVITQNGDYSITGSFIVSAPAVAGTECDPDSVPVPVIPPPHCYYSIVYFDSLTVAYGNAAGVQVEPGAEARVTSQDLADTRTALRSLMVGLGQWAAAQMLEAAQGLSGFSSSYSSYQQGIQAPAPGSITDFRTAFCSAELAIDNNVPDPFAPEFALHAVAAPRFIATRAGRPVDYLIGVFGAGAGGVGIANVSGGPPGATFTLSSVDPSHPAWRELHVVQNGPPGTYPITVTFTSGVPPLSLTLDLDDHTLTGVGPEPARPLPEAFVLYGVRPNPLTTRGMLRVDVPTRSVLSLAVFDVSGRRVREIVSGRAFGPGTELFLLDSRALAPGVYHVRLEAVPVDGIRPPFRAATKLVVSL